MELSMQMCKTRLDVDALTPGYEPARMVNWIGRMLFAKRFRESTYDRWISELSLQDRPCVSDLGKRPRPYVIIIQEEYKRLGRGSQ